MENNQLPPVLTPEDEVDTKRRLQAFNAEMMPLLKKYKLGIGATASITADGRVVAKPLLFDDSRSKNQVENKPSGEKTDSGLETAE